MSHERDYPKSKTNLMKKISPLLIVWLAAIAFLAFTDQLSTARAQGTAFTYQGRLFDGTNPANGLYDIRGSVWNAATAGAMLSGYDTNLTVSVSNGLFTVLMDFGPGVFIGANDWLEIGVRTNGAVSFTELTPRQELTPTPYAIFAEGAAAAGLTGPIPSGDLSGTYSGLVVLNNASDSFTGNGSGLTGVNAATVDGLPASDFWQLGGNAGTTAGVNFVGTTDNQPLDLDSDGVHGLQLAYASRFSSFPFIYSQDSMNVIGGYWGNTVSNNVIGATIAGGGDEAGSFFPLAQFNNTVTGDFGAVGGGYANTAGYASMVPGGYDNIATGTGSFAAGRYAQTTNSGNFVWSDGTQSPFQGAGANAFDVLASGGAHFHTGAAGVAVDQLNLPGGGGSGLAWRSSVAGVTLGPGGDGPFLWGYDGGGLGTVLPDEISLTWDYNGNVWVSNNCSVASLTIRGGADLAEPFNISIRHGEVTEGAVVIIDEQNPGQLRLSDTPYDTHVAGVVSGANGINPGIQMHQQGLMEGGKNVALTGRVYVQADASNGAIKPGDLLTTSSTPGYAMKVTDHARAAGAILGKAMTGLNNGRGMVLVLVTLQ